MLAYEYSHSKEEGGYLLMTIPLSKSDYLSYAISQSHPDIKYREMLDERRKFNLRVAPKNVPFNWIDRLPSVLSDTIDILAELFPKYSTDFEFKHLLKTLLYDWSKGVALDEIMQIVNVICHHYETDTIWSTVQGNELRINSMSPNPDKLISISTNNALSHFARQENENILICNATGTLKQFTEVTIESLQRAYVCTFLFSEFQI